MEIVELVIILIVSLVALSYRREANYLKTKADYIALQYAKQNVKLKMLRDKLDKMNGVDIDEQS